MAAECLFLFNFLCGLLCIFLLYVSHHFYLYGLRHFHFKEIEDELNGGAIDLDSLDDEEKAVYKEIKMAFKQLEFVRGNIYLVQNRRTAIKSLFRANPKVYNTYLDNNPDCPEYLKI